MVSGTIRDILFSVFERVEEQHGWLLVSHALGYISAGRHGLSEPELLDILSCDEEVSAGDEVVVKKTKRANKQASCGFYVKQST